MVNNSVKKTTKGRRKIEIKKIEENNSRQVTFSKRRTGLFKKASELCVLTGAQVAILVNSPGGRVFAFGHPSADTLINRYLKTNNNNNKSGSSVGTVTVPTQEFNQHYVSVSRELELEKRRIPASSEGRTAWFEGVTEGLGQEELEQYLWALVKLKSKVVTRADELMMINKAPVMLGGASVGWGDFNGGQTVGVPTNGGFVFQHGGEIGRF